MSDSQEQQDTQIGTILDRTKVYAAGLEHARALMTGSDPFLANQSTFDRQARMRLPVSAQQVTAYDYLTFLNTQLRPWTAQELQGLASIFNSIQRKLMAVTRQLPDKIFLIKTSGQEEGFSAYTRHMDTIVMSETKVALMTGGGGDALHSGTDIGALEDIYIHETFHLLSKNNPAMRRQLYAKIGYHQIDQPLTLPAGANWVHGTAMADMKITNPDTPDLDVVIDLIPPDEPGDGPKPMMPVLLANGSCLGSGGNSQAV